MTLWGRPLGIWVLWLWCLFQGLPALVGTLNSGGAFRALVWGFFLLQGFFAVGLLLRLPLARHLLLIYLAINFFLLSLAVWFFVYTGLVWGAHRTDVLAVLVFVAYLLYLSWGFIYLFHPAVVAYFRSRTTFANASSI
jgi:hypothetical protein